jgi:hypothetical protein
MSFTTFSGDSVSRRERVHKCLGSNTEFVELRLVLIRTLANMAVTANTEVLTNLWNFVMEPDGPCIEYIPAAMII